MLMAQQVSKQTSTYTFDASGQRVDGPNYTAVESPTGSQHVETARSINGRMVPIQAEEDKVIRQDSQGKVVERMIRKYDAQGNPGPPTKVRIEETKNSDGSTTIQSVSYQADINGNMHVSERAITKVSKGATTETSTTVERATLNGSLEPVEKSMSVERPSGGGSEVQSTTYRRDVSGNFTPAIQEVKQIKKSGNEETTDAAHYEVGTDGKMALTSRAIDRVKTNPDGSQVAETDVYSKFTAGHAGDTNADQPRLQEQIRKERVPAGGGKIIETTTSRAHLPNDPTHFGPYERVSQTTYVSTDASGREVKNTEAVTGRRDINGQIIPQEGRAENSVATKK
jgi:hypothetical protein